jgi:hypothetical protein
MPATNKPASHKRKKWTQKESPNRSFAAECALVRRSSINAPPAVAPVVTQTQGDASTEDSPDQALKAMIQFVELSWCCRLFRESSRAGDLIAMECLCNEFIPVWLAVGKDCFCEVGLSQIKEPCNLERQAITSFMFNKMKGWCLRKKKSSCLIFRSKRVGCEAWWSDGRTQTI